MDIPSLSKDEVDYRSLGNSRALEWRHLRLKCRLWHLEPIYQRYCQLSAVCHVKTFVYVIEFLMLMHVVLICSLVKNFSPESLVPFAVVMLLTPLIMLPNRKVYIKHYYGITLATSWVMAFALVLMDIFVAIIFRVEYPLVPAYDHVVLVSVYMFLPIAFLERGKVYLLGLAVSLVYFFYMFWDLWAHRMFVFPTLVFYAVYLIFLNMLMMFFRVLREYHGRLSIVCRFQLICQNIVYILAMKKETSLVESVLPFQMGRTLQEEMARRFEDTPLSLLDHAARAGLLYLEPHPEVSILVAHLVNFTNLTSSLVARELVEVLHELFVNFDLAAQRNRAVRIQFQGDAYTCVAGIPNYFPTHASSCVNQALEMIRMTEGLSQRRGLNTNMRIGVHSGEIVAGVIGHTKWQFDIWSRDVHITNRLEVTGRPGLVHVSNRTLSLLASEYLYEEGTEQGRKDPILQRAHITTYLVRSRNPDLEHETSVLEEVLSDHTLTPGRVSFSNIYEDIQMRAQREMILEVERMPVGCEIRCCSRKRKPRQSDSLDNEYVFNTKSCLLFTTFRSWKLEWGYHKQPDLILKYSLLLMLYAGISIFFMSRVTTDTAFNHAIMLGCLGILLLVCFLASYKKLWLHSSRGPKRMSQPGNCLSRGFYKLSEVIERSMLLRIPLVIVAVFVCYVMTSNQAFTCNIAKLEMEIIEADLQHLEVKSLCFMPWEITYAVVVVLSLLFVIIGLPLTFKLGAGLIILGLHLSTIHAFYGFAFERSRTTDKGLRADYAHTWYLVAFFVLLLVRERQLNYILRALYFMLVCHQRRLLQTQAKRRSMEIIMANLLPSHVLGIFEERRRNNEMYYENLAKVAVMFASIESYEVDRAGLRVLHEFICYFDDLLAKYQGKYKIEKIKVRGWTYMAVCGLQTDQYPDYSINMPREPDADSKKDRRSASVHFVDDKDEEPSTSSMRQDLSQQTLSHEDTAALIMTEFALDLLRTMQDIRSRAVLVQHDSPLKGSLQIGISHGPVMTGVVGFSQPHYDVWGHTVNMASLMNSTGVQDSIHVTETTAQALEKFKIRCNYRGRTKLKGGGEVPTYLVALNDQLGFVYTNEVDAGPQSTTTVTAHSGTTEVHEKTVDFRKDHERKP